MSTQIETDTIKVMERAIHQLKESIATERALRGQIRDYEGRIDAAIRILKGNGVSTTTTGKSRIELDAERALRFAGVAPEAGKGWACPECGRRNPPEVVNCPVEGCGTPKAAEASKEQIVAGPTAAEADEMLGKRHYSEASKEGM